MKSGKLSFYTSLIYLEKQSKPRLVALSILLVILLGTIDYLTGFELTFSFFYLLPVAIASWGVGRYAGPFLSAFSAVIWIISNLLAGEAYSSAFVAIWNTLMRFIIFTIMSLLLHALRSAMEEERHLARTDPLTGALNRRAFYGIVTTKILFAKPTPPPCTLIYIDLDNFKPINDKFGHSTGDVVLTTVVRTIAGELGADETLARLGGDEFIILMNETDPAALKATVTNIQQVLLKAMQAQDWQVTFSIGVLTFLKPSGSVSQMITMADQLMYEAKSGTKNAVVYSVFPPPPAAPRP